MDIEKLVRPHILQLSNTAGRRILQEGKIYLDASENAFGSPVGSDYHRYPDPSQQKLKEKISAIKGVPTQHILLGNGSDELIDFLIRLFCEPGHDKIMICPPTYDRYQVWANVNNVSAVHVNLKENFQLDVPAMVKAIDENEHLKILFICSPGNPTGASLYYDDIEFLLNNFPGIVVVDEAYINYSRQRSFIRELTEYENLVVLQTFSKAWGLAGLRLGMAFSSDMIIDWMDQIRPPNNIGRAIQKIGTEALEHIDTVNARIKKTVEEKIKLAKELEEKHLAEKVYPSDTNFLLVKFKNAKNLYLELCKKGIMLSDCTDMPLCENCLRITIGTPEENKLLIETITGISDK